MHEINVVYLKERAQLLRNIEESVNAVEGDNHCSFWEMHETYNTQ